MSSGHSRPASAAARKPNHKSFSLAYQTLGLPEGQDQTGRKRQDTPTIGSRFGETGTFSDSAKLNRGRKPSTASLNRGMRVGDVQPAVDGEPWGQTSSKLKRPPSASGLHFHTASEWADALTSSTKNIMVSSSPVKKTPWLLPENRTDAVGRWGDSSGRFDGTATVTRLISTIHGDHYDAHWLNRTDDGGNDRVGDPSPEGIRPQHSYSPLSRPGSAKSRPHSVASSKQLIKQKHGLDTDVDSPRQASYLDGIVVKLGKPLPRACLQCLLHG
jgi:hypothetical protein